MRILLAFILSAALFGICPDAAVARVLVYDDVALRGQEVMLRAETRGALFNRGGEVVEFIVDGKSIGKNLSGRDGFAVKGFVPARTGLYKINVKSGEDKDSGILLALEKKNADRLYRCWGLLAGRAVWRKRKTGEQKGCNKNP